MTTYVSFVPSPQAPFQFTATLDGNQYKIVVTWLLFAQRWYVSCYDQTGNLIFSLPLIGSPDGYAISALSWSGGTVTAVTAPHGFPVGQVVSLAIAGNTPSAYNGQFACAVQDFETLTYAIASDPGLAATYGSATANINLAAGYFSTSTLIFRQSTQMFEVSP